MAGYSDDYYTSVDELFGQIRPSPFTILEDPVPQEQKGGLEPAGWVQNADGDTGEAYVTIDADGLTIRNGKIFLEDPGGSSVLGPAGFDGSWIDFLNSGVYNSSFGSGTQNSLDASTEVNGASTVDDYDASLSTDIPYWVISESSAGPFIRQPDVEAPSGWSLVNEEPDVDFMLYQDIPVSPNVAYVASVTWSYLNSGASEFTLEQSYQWRDINHAAIGSVVGGGLAFNSAGFSTLTDEVLFYTDKAPTGARYIRVFFGVNTNIVSDNFPQFRIAGFSVKPNLFDYSLNFDGSYGAIEMFNDFDNDVFPTFSLFASNGAIEQYMNQTPQSFGLVINGGGSATFGSTFSRYWYIGKMVFVKFGFTVTANGSGSSVVTVAATGHNIDRNGGTVMCGILEVAGTRNVCHLVATAAGSLNTWNVIAIGGSRTGGGDTLVGSELTNGMVFYFTGFFEAD